MQGLKILLTGLMLTAAMAVRAQSGEVKMTVDYSVAIPVGSFKNDAVSDVSPRGWNAGILYYINDRFSIGGNLSFQDFYQKYPRRVYKTTDGSDISAVLSNSIQTMPLTVTGRYHFLPGKAIQPYAGAGVGGNLISYVQYLGEFEGDSKSKVGFTARPEAGIYIPFSKNKLAGIDINAAYNYMPFNYGGINNLDNFMIRAGISFPLRR